MSDRTTKLLRYGDTESFSFFLSGAETIFLTGRNSKAKRQERGLSCVFYIHGNNGALAWFDAAEKCRSKTNGDTWLNIPRGPSAWKKASTFSLNHWVRWLWPNVPSQLLGWAPASCINPMIPAAWFADRIPDLPLLVKTNPPRTERLRAAFVVVPLLVLAVDVLAVDADWLVLEVDVDRLVLVVDIEDGLSCCRWTCCRASGGIANISIPELLSSDESPAITSLLSINLSTINE